MMFKSFILILVLVVLSCLAQNTHRCIQQSLKQVCTQQLYRCLNTPTCSYQLSQNTKHIYVSPKHDDDFPALYFSDSYAVTLYECMRTHCSQAGIKLPALDQSYPRKLQLPFCISQVSAKCGQPKNMSKIYEDLKQKGKPEESDPVGSCYWAECIK